MLNKKSNEYNESNSYQIQMKKWAEFALTKVMPLIPSYSKQKLFGYHGLTHTENVVLRGIDYAISENTNPIPVILACALHDCARTHDSWDDKHAENAVPIAENFLKDHDFDLTEEEKKSIIEAVKGHTHGTNTQDKIAACLWDADRTRLAWEYEFAYKENFSTKRGLEVACFDTENQKKYAEQQKKLLEAIGAPSYILMEKEVTSYKNTQEALVYKDIRPVGTDETPIICYHGTPDDISKFRHSSSHSAIGSTVGSAYFTPAYCYAERYTLNRTVKRSKVCKTQDSTLYLGNANIDWNIYIQYLTHKYGRNVMVPIFQHINKQKTDKPATLTEQEIKKILTDNRQINNQDDLDIICNIIKDKPIQIKKIPTRLKPFVYKVELRGIFPRNTSLSFKKQEIEMPMERICTYFKIDYPIKDNKKFLHQVLKSFGTENNYLNAKKTFQKNTSKHLDKILQLSQKIITTQNRLKEIDTLLTPDQKGIINKIKNYISQKKKQELTHEKVKLRKELQSMNKEKEAIQAKKLKEEQSFNNLFGNMIKLDNFLSYVDVSNTKGKLQEEDRKTYVEMMQHILKTYIEERSLEELIKNDRLNEDEYVRKQVALIDGVQHEDGIQNYVVYNLDSIKIVARYTLNSDGTIKKIEKPNSLGQFAPEPQKSEAKKTKGKYLPLFPNNSNSI